MAPPVARTASTTAESATATKAGSTARAGQAKTTGEAKTGKAATTAATRTASKPQRKAVLARNVGGGGATPRPAARRKS